METQQETVFYYLARPLSLLAREINWMETLRFHNSVLVFLFTLYSLEKLIEWKQWILIPSNQLSAITLYSLEKLIEWKLKSRPIQNGILSALYSLEKLIEWKLIPLFFPRFFGLFSLYSLEKLIEWKLRLFLTNLITVSLSLLAREINWMETI